mmetsp:Transcript_14180/g.20397  ORF Transcript_14180/g.20397 Transcript_14180/m.20397 type:complete len:394 (+) Transcript_14180:3-1184(+)
MERIPIENRVITDHSVDAEIIPTGTPLDDTLRNSNDMLNGLSSQGKSSPGRSLLGTLDPLFEEPEDVLEQFRDERLSKSYLAELEVQESLAYLLRASAAKKLESVNTNLMVAMQLLEERIEIAGVDGPDAASTVTCGVEELDEMNIGDLQIFCQSSLRRFQQLQSTAQRLDESAKRISTSLYQYSRVDETRVSPERQREVVKLVDEFVEGLPEDNEAPVPEDSNSLFEESSKDENENYDSSWDEAEQNDTFEEDMENIDRDWGTWAENDFVGTGASNQSPSLDAQYQPPEMGQEDEFHREDESFEEVISRLDEDWGEWENSSIQVIEESKISPQNDQNAPSWFKILCDDRIDPEAQEQNEMENLAEARPPGEAPLLDSLDVPQYAEELDSQWE